jgi:SAM-dependent methyltransferase
VTVEATIARLTPAPELEERIRAHLRAQLGRVLPPDPARGLDWYYDWVVLGSRAAEALAVMLRHGRRADLPWVDVGSGLGSFVLLAALEGRTVIGVEPAAAEVELARARAAAILPGAEPRFELGVGEALPLGEGVAAGVLLHDVLEHVGDWRAVLREARRVLAPGGIVYVKGPSYAVRFVEPHYRVPWLPLLPKALARPYLRALGRDPGYLGHIGYRRRGEVLAELRRLGFSLHFPRLDKLREPSTINRPWMRRLVGAASRRPGLMPAAERLAESPLQPTIDVVASLPG